jgi:general L-amino acid transport system permease protein
MENQNSVFFVRKEFALSRPAPASTVGVLGWIRSNLFSTPFNSLLTILMGGFGVWLIWGALDWLIFNAVWTGGNEACKANSDGACWTFIGTRFDQFVYGFYEKSERWRVDLVLVVLFVGVFWSGWERSPARKWIGGFMLIPFPLIAWGILYGGIFGLPVVETSQWGGFILTLVVALLGIIASLPLGILLALGRRSNMPIIRSVCVVFIEFWRGVPLITVLFMAAYVLPLFFPTGMNFDQLLRALIGVALFSAAYMAEVVRGGLQSLNKGQYEAADSLGLSYWRSMRLIILPQALKAVIPGIVNTFIGLFKDTTLVLIIGLLDLLGMVNAAIADPNWSIRSVPTTGYAFVAITFFIFCYGMSRYSRFVEEKLNTGHKR